MTFTSIRDLVIRFVSVRAYVLSLRSGQTNVTARVRVLAITSEKDKASLSTVNLRPSKDLHEVYPWTEYVVRAGWYSNGQRY
jgi:hypothetical protein